jgi:hypothetical protein
MSLLSRTALLLLALLAIVVLTTALAPPPVYEHKVSDELKYRQT